MIAAACTCTIRKAPRYTLVRNGEMPVWSGFCLAGEQSITVTAFRSLAEELHAQGLTEGDSLTVHGKLTLEAWTDREGKERQTLKIVADKAEALQAPAPKQRAPRRRPAARPGQDPAPAPARVDDELNDDLPEWL